ncbi:acyl-CoA thioester hydrolase [Ochrobactrum daejeonense]|uniref:Acyl-CoA thioester hydrolase n=1 Tax=Brucella daejeonensis TaxID=659015 RepID=A0A7W9EPL7_9HYPH|nr:thioesterase family protein [Brucella daejeonensis]MBB5703936.1 acyl-CoA thioester hydrolase [Brucella daejeonensis]
MPIPSRATRTIITPRVSETDGCGHINNTTLPVWFEAGRRRIFEAITPSMNFSDWKLSLVEMNVSFLKQIYLNADVEISTWVSKLGNKSLTIRETASQNGVICAKGAIVYVYFDYQAQQSLRIPDDVRVRLSGFVHEAVEESEK